MGDSTKIEWADKTFNPWIGCTKVSPGCDNCYAAAQDKHRKWTPEGWGSGKPRKRTSEANWKKPLTWDRKAAKEGKRYRVFCASLADVFDNEVPQGWRDDLFALIRATPYLNWQLLTKRIGNVPDMLPDDWGDGYANVWLGITICNQDEADRDIPKLLDVPARLRFLSCEPLLGIINLRPFIWNAAPLDWVIVGGESGPNARAFDGDRASDIIEQVSVATALKQGRAYRFFFKQFGSRPQMYGKPLSMKNKKGADMSEWPEHLRIREIPG